MAVLLKSSVVLEVSYTFLRPQFSCQWNGNSIICLIFIPSISIISPFDSFPLDNLPFDSFYKQKGKKIQCFPECSSYVSIIPMTMFMKFRVLCECLTMEKSVDHCFHFHLGKVGIATSFVCSLGIK